MATTPCLKGEIPKNLVALQLQKVEVQLKALEHQLNQTFMFDPIPIRVNTCDHKKLFDRSGDLTQRKL